MKYRKIDPKTKVQIVKEALEGKMSIAEICNKYAIGQNTLAYWLKLFEERGHQIFEPPRRSKNEQRVIEENKTLKRIIAELVIALKKTEMEIVKV